MKTRIVHIMKESYDIYIGRGRNSIWGNPFSHKEGTIAKFKTNSRKESIEKFEEYLLCNDELLEQIPSLKGKTLGCWCKKSNTFVECHGDLLVDIINIMIVYKLSNVSDAVSIYKKNKPYFVKNRKLNYDTNSLF